MYVPLVISLFESYGAIDLAEGFFFNFSLSLFLYFFLTKRIRLHKLNDVLELRTISFLAGHFCPFSSRFFARQ